LLAQKLIQAAPGNPAINDTVGWAYYKRGQYDFAVTHLEKAAKSRDAQATYHLAMAYFSSGKRNLGQKALVAAVQLNPSLPEAKLARALAESEP